MSGGRFWTSDLHLGHGLVARLRGFDERNFASGYIKANDDRIMQQLTELPADSELFILGDISSGKAGAQEAALERLQDVKATMHLISGNHDSVASIHRRGFRHQRRFLEVFETVQDFMRIKVEGEEVLMSHYPYVRSGDGPGRNALPRYAQFRLPDLGSPLIHGYTHQPTPYISMPDERPDLGQYCVGWDVLRRPVTQRDLKDWMDTRKAAQR